MSEINLTDGGSTENYIHIVEEAYLDGEVDFDEAHRLIQNYLAWKRTEPTQYMGIYDD